METTPETIAHIAAHFLEGDDYKGAAKRAYALLKAADDEIREQHDLERRIMDSAIPKDVPVHLDFAQGIRFITGQNRRDRAEEYFTDFISKQTKGKKELNEAIARYERQGFDGLVLDALRKMYQKPNVKAV